MSDMDPRLEERLRQLYDHIESTEPPATLEHVDAGALGRHQRLVHVLAGVAVVAVLAAAVGGLVVGLSSHRTAAPLPAPATSHVPGPVVTTPIVAPSFNPPATPAPSFAGFQPVSMSAISESQYWVLGYSGTTCSPCNAVLLHTMNSGGTFQQVPAPPVLIDSIGAGVRFADASDGYIFGSTVGYIRGSAVWVTHDGGAHWHAVLQGEYVPDLEPGAAGFVYAAVQHCEANLSSCGYTVERSQAGGDSWSSLALPGASTGYGAIGVHGTSLWVMQFGSGKLYVSRDAGNSFSTATFPCDPSLSGSLDPVSDSVVWAFCATGTEGGPRVSTDGGHTWSSQRGGGFSNGGMAAGVSPTTAFLTDGSATLQVTHDQGRTYSTAIGQPQEPAWVGFTDAAVGYAVAGTPTNSPGTQLWRTTDGGAIWVKVSFAG